MDISEAQAPDWREDLLFLVIVGKQGKMEERRQPRQSHPGGQHAPYYLGKSDIR